MADRSLSQYNGHPFLAAREIRCNLTVERVVVPPSGVYVI